MVRNNEKLGQDSLLERQLDLLQWIRIGSNFCASEAKGRGAYAQKSIDTIREDLRALRDAGLIVSSPSNEQNNHHGVKPEHIHTCTVEADTFLHALEEQVSKSRTASHREEVTAKARELLEASHDLSVPHIQRRGPKKKPTKAPQNDRRNKADELLARARVPIETSEEMICEREIIRVLSACGNKAPFGILMKTVGSDIEMGTLVCKQLKEDGYITFRDLHDIKDVFRADVLITRTKKEYEF